MYGKEIDRVLISKEQIAKRVKELGEQITKDYAGESLTIVCTLRGAVLFFADLIREIKCDMVVDFIACSSYGNGTSTSGEVIVTKDLSSPVEGKNILIIEDIIDSGVTLNYLVKLLKARNPKSVKICSVLNKASRRTSQIQGDYIGFEIEDEFVVGYGLDYAQKFRNLPDICVLSRDVYGG